MVARALWCQLFYFFLAVMQVWGRFCECSFIKSPLGFLLDYISLVSLPSMYIDEGISALFRL